MSVAAWWMCVLPDSDWKPLRRYHEGQHADDERYRRRSCGWKTFCPSQRGSSLTGKCQERPCPIKEHSSTLTVKSRFRRWLFKKADKLHFVVSDFFFFFSSAALSLCDTPLPICPSLRASHYLKWNKEFALNIWINQRAYLRGKNWLARSLAKAIGKRSESSFWRWPRKRRQCHQLRCSIIYLFLCPISFFLASFPSSICWFLHLMNAIHLPRCESHIAPQSSGCCSNGSLFRLDFRCLRASHEYWCAAASGVKTEGCFALDGFTSDQMWSGTCDRSDSVGLAVRLWTVGKGLWVVMKRMWLQISMIWIWVCDSESLFLWIGVMFMAHVHAGLGNSLWPSTSNVA